MGRAQELTGELLVAAPNLNDPNFHRTVVLVLHHDADDGAFGVVLNRPLPVGVATVLPAWQPVVSLPPNLFQGGPMALDEALGLATLWPVSDGHPAVNRVVGPFGLVDLDSDPQEGARRVTGLRVFAGHAGWSAGQLEQEVAAGDWYVLPAEPDDAVTPLPTSLWRRVLRRQGGSLAIVSTFPEDPRLN